MFDKVITKKDFENLIKDEMVIMVGGFLGCGTPETLVEIILEKGVKNLTLITNDTSFTNKGVGRLIASQQVARVITSHIGTNPETARQMVEGTLKVELVPQGTLAERIRSAGAGLGGFLTPTGVGTIVEEGKQKLTIDGHEYLLETPLKADLAIILGGTVDPSGNVVYNATARNFNPLMAMAAETVVVEAEKMVKIGEIMPELVMTPGPLVTHIFRSDRN
ncbi:MAG: acetate CoA-transferase subunit alpha [Candidatus Riflebacteria bacterium]|nr:acetate CoA-transferase subunit alpha [Candidatus Riflebacteria bacterium]